MGENMKGKFSNKISVVRCVLMIMIIYCHAYNLSIYTLNDTVISKAVIIIERVFYGWNKYCGDALFFIISGYLLYTGYNKNTIGRKLVSRSKSLLLPYLFWNTVYWIFWCLIGIIPVFSTLVSDTGRFSFSVKSTIFRLLKSVALSDAKINNLFYTSIKKFIIFVKNAI